MAKVKKAKVKTAGEGEPTPLYACVDCGYSGQQSICPSCGRLCVKVE